MAWLLAALFVVSCEDLEDTYDEYAGNGMIRYVGKCSDLEIQPGWERLRVVWKGNLDAAVDRVKITWQSELDAKPTVRFVEPRDVLEGDLMDTVYLENLQDAVYTVTVSNLSADSTESIVETKYGRPYTEAHEDLRTFTRGIVNFYEVGEKLVVVLDGKNDNLKEVKVNFWGTDGKEYTWDIRSHMGATVGYGMLRDYMFLLPEQSDLGIDFSKPLTIKRRGILTGCIDEIDFNDEPLSRDERVWSAGFSSWLTKNYGPDWKNKLDQVEIVELDYDMSTFQDLFYGNYISDYTSNYLYIKSTQMYHIFYKYLYLCV